MRVIDLTMRITPSIRVYPGSPQPSFIPWSKFDHQGYDSEAMFMSTHTGTHVDAPSHFKPGLASIDAGADSKFTAHNILLPRNILVVENLCNLDKVASRSSRSSNRSKNNNNTTFTLIISPLKLGGATGSPARVLALL